VNQIFVWDLTGRGEPIRLEGHPAGSVTCLAFSPDGARLAGAGADLVLRCWDTRTGRAVFAPVPDSGYWTGLAFSPDGRRLAAAGINGLVRLWDAAAGTELLTLRMLSPLGTGHYGFRARVVFSPDGTRLAANDWEGTVTVWNASP
jgi:WD40 repeat protein